MWAINTEHLNQEKQKFLEFVRRNEKLGLARRRRCRRRRDCVREMASSTSPVNYNGYREWQKTGFNGADGSLTIETVRARTKKLRSLASRELMRQLRGGDDTTTTDEEQFGLGPESPDRFIQPFSSPINFPSHSSHQLETTGFKMRNQERIITQTINQNSSNNNNRMLLTIKLPPDATIEAAANGSSEDANRGPNRKKNNQNSSPTDRRLLSLQKKSKNNSTTSVIENDAKAEKQHRISQQHQQVAKSDLKLTISKLSIELDNSFTATSKITRSKVLIEEKLKSLTASTSDHQWINCESTVQLFPVPLDPAATAATAATATAMHTNIDTQHFSNEAEFSNWLCKTYKDPRRLLEIHGTSSSFLQPSGSFKPTDHEPESEPVVSVLPYLPLTVVKKKLKTLKNPHKQKKKPALPQTQKAAEKEKGADNTAPSKTSSNIPSLPSLFEFYPHATKSQRRLNYRSLIQNAYESKMVNVHKKMVAKADGKLMKKEIVDSAYHNSVELPNHEKDLKIKKVDQDVVRIPFGLSDSLPDLKTPSGASKPKRSTAVVKSDNYDTAQDFDRTILPDYAREINQAVKKPGDDRRPSLQQAQLVEEVIHYGELEELDSDAFECVENEYDLFNPALSYARTMKARRLSGINSDVFNFETVSGSANVVVPPQVNHNSPTGDPSSPTYNFERRESIKLTKPDGVSNIASGIGNVDLSSSEKKPTKSILVNRRHSIKEDATKSGAEGTAESSWVHEAAKQRLHLIDSDDYLQGYLFGEDEFIPEEYYVNEDELSVAQVSAQMIVEGCINDPSKVKATEPGQVLTAKSAGKRGILKVKTRSQFGDLLSRARTVSMSSQPDSEAKEPAYNRDIPEKSQRELSDFLKDFNYYESFNKVHKLNAYNDIINQRKLSLIDEKSYKYSSWVNKYLQMSRENSGQKENEDRSASQQ